MGDGIPICCVILLRFWKLTRVTGFILLSKRTGALLAIEMI